MKRITMALIASAVVATPAVAQWHQPDHSVAVDRGPAHEGGWDRNDIWQGAPENPYQRIQFLQDRMNRAVAEGRLDRRQAWRVNQELNGVRQWIGRMHWEGERLTPDQRARVQARLDDISRQIRWLRHND